jgi:hypothetical protein
MKAVYPPGSEGRKHCRNRAAGCARGAISAWLRMEPSDDHRLVASASADGHLRNATSSTAFRYCAQQPAQIARGAPCVCVMRVRSHRHAGRPPLLCINACRHALRRVGQPSPRQDPLHPSLPPPLTVGIDCKLIVHTPFAHCYRLLATFCSLPAVAPLKQTLRCGHASSALRHARQSHC